VLLILGLLAGAAAVVGVVFVGRAVDDAVDEATGGQGIGGVFGGECAEFQMAYLSISFTGMLGAGVDDAQREQMDAQLGELEELVPAEIEGDFAVVSAALREAMAVGTGGAGFVGGAEPSEEAQREATAILEDPDVVAAQENINAWVERNCS
jgi:hypothetical protein